MNPICRRQPASRIGRNPLSRSEAHELKHENREIAHDAREQAQDGLGLSRGEQRDINRQQDELNRKITRETR